jgi:hypothetical protein
MLLDNLDGRAGINRVGHPIQARPEPRIGHFLRRTWFFEEDMASTRTTPAARHSLPIWSFTPSTHASYRTPPQTTSALF